MKYTKGDWKAFRFSKYHNWKVAMGDRNEFLDLGQDEEAKANAQLIASAPDLYEALKALVINEEECGIAKGQSVIRAEKALAKADGK